MGRLANQSALEQTSKCSLGAQLSRRLGSGSALALLNKLNTAQQGGQFAHFILLMHAIVK